MSTQRRIIGWLIGITGFLVALFIIGALVAPKLIKTEAVNRFLEQKFSKEIGGSIDFRQIDLSWFPRPHAVVREVTFSLSEDIDGKMAALHFYPKIVPLLWGNFHLSKLRAIKPEYNISLSDRSVDNGSGQSDFRFNAVLKQVHDLILSFPGFTLTGVDARLKDGSLNIFEGDRRIFGFRDLQASYSRPAHKTQFNLTCKSNLWNDITINGWLDPAEFNSRGNIRFAEFRPHALSEYFFPDSPLKITEALANLVIDFELHGPDWFQANIEGSVPIFKLINKHRNLEIKDSLIAGAVRITNNETSFSVEKLTMLYPRINLSGKLTFDQKQPLVTLDVEGRKFDVESIRKLALEMGGNSKILRIVFNIIRGGEVPQVTLSSKGKQIEDLIDLENIVVRGEMRDGNIFIPEVDLDLKRVAGTVVILDGLLQGYGLKAQMGGSLGKNGKLKLGLNNDINPFHLDILIHADLSQLPPILKRVVKDENFINELALVKNASGEALGKLTIDFDKKHVGVKVEASEVQLDAVYQRIPYPVKISGGPFFFDGLQVGFSNFDVGLGKSLFSHVSSTLKWQKSTRLTFASETASLHMDEIFPWLESLGTIPSELEDVGSVNGLIHIDSITFSGPLMSPEKWQIQSRGKFKQLSIHSKKLPGPLQIIRGQFASQDTRVRLNHVDAVIEKSSFSDIAGGFDWGKANRMTIVSGSASIKVDELYAWLVKFDAANEYLKKFPPINGTLALKSLNLKGPFLSPKTRQINISAKFDASIFDSKRFPAPLQIDRGEFSLLGERIVLTNCNGTLGKSTFSQLAMTLDWGEANALKVTSESITLFVGEIWPWASASNNVGSTLRNITAAKGIIRVQDLQVNAPLNRPEQWRISASGDLQNIHAQSEFLDQPIILTQGKFILTQRDLSGVPHNCIKLGSTRLTWGQSHLLLIGDIFFSPDKFFVDMNISADNAGWARIEKILNYANENENKDGSRNFSRPSVEASLRINSDKFNYDDYTFQPLQVDVSLKPDEVIVTIEKADLCRISITGIIKLSDQSLEYYLVPSSRSKELESTLSCLTNERASASGKFNLDGEVMAKAKLDEATRIFSGGLDFSAKNGRIYRLGLLAKIFAILNVTEIYRGEIPDLVGDGFAYEKMIIKADLKGKKLVMQECAIDGASMGLACEGEIDLVEDKINLVILVAPFKTVDRLVKKIPLISSILGGKIISIPFRAKGDLDNPVVIPLSPTAVGSGVLGIMERTLKLPITIIQPMLPDEDDSTDKDDQGSNNKP
jgi:hypothetical protein